MKTVRKLLFATLSLLLAIALLGGCAKTEAPAAEPTAAATGTPDGAATDAPTDAPATNDGKVFKIGVIQLVQHSALDSSYEGFIEGLKQAGYVDGQNIQIEYQNAAGDQSNCQTIADSFINDGKDLILAIATPAAQAVAMKTTEIPILITAVTDPADAGLVESNEMPNTNVSGTSDLTPVALQIQLLKELLPEAKTIGVLYCSSESNSVYQANLAKEAAQALGMEVIDATISNSNELQQVTSSIADRVDAIYAPTDNMVAAGMATVALVTNEAKVPVVCGEPAMVEAGGLITRGISYYDLGVRTGQQAARILEGADIRTMPIEYLAQEELVLAINEDTVAAIGITIPETIR